MHLEIILPKANREQVTAEIINKLYNLAYSNPNLGISSKLDNTSTISGSVSLYAANKKRVEYLAGTNGVGGNGRFPDLLIYCTTYYIDFIDDTFSTVCANLYGNTEGTTVADLTGLVDSEGRFTVTNTNKNLVASTSGNSSIKTLDFRQFPTLYITGNIAWNLPSLQNIYIASASLININSWGGVGSYLNNAYHIDKLIVGVYRLIKSSYLDIKILLGSTNNPKIIFETIAIRSFDIHENSNLNFGNYTTRGGINITNLYLGPTSNNSVINYSGAYGDNLNSISNIYVPTGMKLAYIDNGTWVLGGTPRTNFIEYNFDTDPDNIFEVLEE